MHLIKLAIVILLIGDSQVQKITDLQGFIHHQFIKLNFIVFKCIIKFYTILLYVISRITVFICVVINLTSLGR